MPLDWRQLISGGGTITIPPGIHHINAPLPKIPSYTTIWAYGAVLQRNYLAPFSAGGDATPPEPIFETAPGAAEVKIFGPSFTSYTTHQNDTELKPDLHPWCMRFGDVAGKGSSWNAHKCRVRDVVFGHGIVKGIYSGGGNYTFENILGTPVECGIEIDTNGSTGRLLHVFMNDPWCHSGSPMYSWMKANGTGFRIKRTDQLSMAKCFSYNYNRGFHFLKGKVFGFVGGANGEWHGGGSDFCNYGLDIEQLRQDINDPPPGDLGNGGVLKINGCFFGAEKKSVRINSPAGITTHADYQFESRVELSDTWIHSVPAALMPAVQIIWGRVKFIGGEYACPGDDNGRQHFITCENGHLTITGMEVQGMKGHKAVQLDPGCRRYHLDSPGLGGAGRILNNTQPTARGYINASMSEPEFVST